MPGDFSELRKIIRAKGPQNANQAKKLAKVAVRVVAPSAMRLEEDLVMALEAIPVAEKLRGESGAARQHALDVVDEVEKHKRPKKR